MPASGLRQLAEDIVADKANLAEQAGTVEIAGKKVPRLGFGTMRLTGRGIWGEPGDREECMATVRRALELGVRFIDTADSYGPDVAERIIYDAVYPYPDDLVIATKVGLTRNGPDVIDTDEGPRSLGPKAWPPVGRPEYLRQQALMSMRRLGVDQLDLLQLHRVDPAVPLADQIGELKNMQDEGKLVAVGVSQVTPGQLAEAGQIVTIASVQSRYNVTDREDQPILESCERDGMAYIPWAPLAQGALTAPDSSWEQLARERDVTVQQLALAWLLATSSAMLPIPGTSRPDHLEDNLKAADVRLSDDDMRRLNAVTRQK
jgi:pyridoxine 4-dehydrogenase